MEEEDKGFKEVKEVVAFKKNLKFLKRLENKLT